LILQAGYVPVKMWYCLLHYRNFASARTVLKKSADNNADQRLKYTKLWVKTPFRTKKIGNNKLVVWTLFYLPYL
jgi:hypothetical protein